MSYRQKYLYIFIRKFNRTKTRYQYLDESLFGRNLQVHAKLDPRRLLLVSTGTIGATRSSTLFDLHAEYGEENDEKSDHNGEKRPQNEVIDDFARLRLELLIELEDK